MGMVHCPNIWSACSTSAWSCARKYFDWIAAVAEAVVTLTTLVLIPGGSMVLKAITFAINLYGALKSIYDAIITLMYWGDDHFSLEFLNTK